MSTFGGIYVGNSGITANQNSLNTTAHNLVNLNTKGYTRQQVYQADTAPNDVGASSISPMQAGLGVSYSEARQIRDYFLDKSYRLEVGRDKFYDTKYTGVKELELFFGELEGVAFQDSMLQLYQSFEEWDKIPDDSNNLELVILRSVEFLERANSVYTGLKEYQEDLNNKIEQQVNRINEIGNSIVKLNKEIMRIEAANIEKGNDLRDQRNALLDELSEYTKVDYEELLDGVMQVKVEGELFVTRSACNEMDIYRDDYTGFITPIWSHLAKDGESPKEVARNHPVFFPDSITTSKNDSDVGSLKAMVLMRGDHSADFSDLIAVSGDEISEDYYSVKIENHTMLNAEAEFDRFTHAIITKINDLLSPLTEVTDVNGDTYKVWDEANAPYATDGKGPGEEMFIRYGTPRYTEKTLTVATPTGTEDRTFYVYNEEDTQKRPLPTDAQGNKDVSKASLYTLDSITINPLFLEDESKLPHLTKNGSVNFALTSAMVQIFDEKSITLNPSNHTKITLGEYYQNMINQFASEGEAYKSKEQTIAETVESVGNKRQQVLGVSSDEELSSMIKFQNAFNASSRYINVVNEMIEHIITRL